MFVPPNFVNHTQFISKTPKQLLENSRAIYLQDMPNTNNIGTKTYTLTINTRIMLYRIIIIELVAIR